MDSFSTGSAARAFGVSSATVRRWIKSGDVTASQFPPGKGEFRIQAPEIIRVCGELGRVVPEELRHLKDGGGADSSSFSDSSAGLGLLVYGG